MRSGDLSNRSRNNQSDNNHMQNQTGFTTNQGLKIEGSPMGIKTGLLQPSMIAAANTPLLPPMAKAPSRTYAYQVSQLSVNDK